MTDTFKNMTANEARITSDMWRAELLSDPFSPCVVYANKYMYEPWVTSAEQCIENMECEEQYLTRTFSDGAKYRAIGLL